MKSLKVVLIALVLILTACGKEQAKLIEGCQMVDDCTHANVPGYYCGGKTVIVADAASHGLHDEDFMGHSCITVSIDYETDPSCDPLNPNGTCSSWGGPTHPCCQTIQGPGPMIPLTK